MTGQWAMAFGHEAEPRQEYVQLHSIIEDQGSRYSVTVARVSGREDMKRVLKTLVQNKLYAKATHHSYGVRLRREGVLWESKSDDGETGAGMVILRIMQAHELVNAMVIVTRWYGGVKLFGERFRHVQECAVQGIVEAMKEGR